MSDDALKLVAFKILGRYAGAEKALCGRRPCSGRDHYNSMLESVDREIAQLRAEIEEAATPQTTTN